MNKFRKFLLVQFKTASRSKLFPMLSAHRCVWWGLPSIIISCILYSSYYNKEWIFAQIPMAYRIEWWMKIPTFWIGLMIASSIISVIYLYFVFVHFRIFPMTEIEWKQLSDENYFQ